MFDKREGKGGFIYYQCLNDITSECWKNDGIKERKYKDYGILVENKGRTIDPMIGMGRVRDGRVSRVESVWKWNKENSRAMFVEIFEIQ